MKANLEKELFGKVVIRKYILHPKHKFKSIWDFYITMLLLFVSCSIPYTLAFYFGTTLSDTWTAVHYFIDFSFFVDIVIIFNSAYYDENFNLVQDRKLIARNYLKGWFCVDFLSIIPTDLLDVEDFNQLFKIARFGRLYKLIKLARVTRMLKLIKERNKIAKYFQSILRVNVGFDRLVFFILITFIMCHIAACLWILVAKFDDTTV